MKYYFLFILSFLLTIPVSAAEIDDVNVASYKNPLHWKAYTLSEVRLTDSYFKEAMELHKGYVLSLEVDRLIPHVRKRAGLEPKGENYGGWEKGGGCTYGHYLSSCALMYASTGDHGFIDRLDYMLSELKMCQDKTADGWFISGDRSKKGYEDLLNGNLSLNQPDETKQPWNYNHNGNSWYCIHKVLAGLKDAYVYAQREQAKEILLVLCDYIAEISNKSNSDLFQGMLAVEQGGMNEVLTDVYAITGDVKYLKAAEQFNHINVIYKIANGEDVLFGRHANDQIPKFIGVARQYEYINNELYKKAAEEFWRIVIKDHTLAIGANSCYERFGVPGEESKRLDYSSAETCNTYNMLKLSRQLFMFTGDMKYLNYYEHALYNHILASQDPDMPGCVTYYTSLLPGSFKQYSTPYDSFWCCVGTGMENHAKYGESIYFSDGKNVLINLFIPSELNDKKLGLKLAIETKYPESDTIRIRIKEKGHFKNTLKLRLPDWLKDKPTVLINNAQTSVNSADGYLSINRKIEDNDIITLIVPRKLSIDYVVDEPHFGTIMYGPLVLAGELGKEGMPEDRVSNNRALREAMPAKNIPMLVGNTDNLENWIVQDKKQAMHFNVKNGGKQKSVSLIPYFQMHHQRHTIYWKIYSDSDFAQRTKSLTDEVIIADAENEKKHNLKGENDSIRWHDYFWARNTQYRIAENGGWFAYDLKIDKDETRAYNLICRFWGDESPTNDFDIFIDGKLLKNVNLCRRLFLTYVDDVFSIPSEWTRGKKSVNVRFQSKEGTKAGGLYSLKITADPTLR